MCGKLTYLAVLFFVFGIVTPGIGADTDLGLMGWWTFDGHALDISGNDRHGTINGDPSFGPGVYGTALELDGDDSVTIDNYAGVLDRNAWSASAKVSHSPAATVASGNAGALDPLSRATSARSRCSSRMARSLSRM